MEATNLDLSAIHAGPTDGGWTQAVGLRAPRLRTLIMASLAALVVAVLVLGGTAIGPFIVGYVYIVAVYPVVQALAARGMARWLAIFVTYGMTILAGAVFAVFVFGFLSQTSTFAGSMQRWLSEGIRGLLAQLAGAGATHPADASRFYDAAEQLARRLAQGVVSVVSPPGSGPMGIIG